MLSQDTSGCCHSEFSFKAQEDCDLPTRAELCPSMLQGGPVSSASHGRIHVDTAEGGAPRGTAARGKAWEMETPEFEGPWPLFLGGLMLNGSKILLGSPGLGLDPQDSLVSPAV